jgi:hypothetical protein
LVFKSGFLPRILGILLILGFMLYGIGHIILSFSQSRYADAWPVCVHRRSVILLVALD